MAQRTAHRAWSIVIKSVNREIVNRENLVSHRERRVSETGCKQNERGKL
jgi:hypothetical protein